MATKTVTTMPSDPPGADAVRRALRAGSSPVRLDPTSLAELCDPSVSLDELMLAVLPAAEDLARVPTSDFRVGAVARTASGSLYIGANIELPHATLDRTVHAEQAVTANAAAHGDLEITRLAVTATPCGQCRQFLWELATAPGMVILTPQHGPVALGSLLPMPFGPRDLGGGRGMVSAYDEDLVLRQPGTDPVLTEAALDAARRSYAPYTRAPAGMAARLASGEVVTGSYLESAAFNPSLGAFGALCAASSARGWPDNTLVSCVLVEPDDGLISHSSAVELGLRSLAEEVAFERVVAGSRS